MFKCKVCGQVFENPKTVVETHSLPSPPYEYFDVCDNCGYSDFEEAHTCSDCGEWYGESELYADGICLDCLKDRIDVKNLIDFGDEITQSYEPNDFIKFTFDKIGDEEMENIISEYIEENADDIADWWMQNNET